jgi:excisionase family DNA binding protein
MVTASDVDVAGATSLHPRDRIAVQHCTERRAELARSARPCQLREMESFPVSSNATESAPPSRGPAPLLSVQDLADLLGTCATTVRRLARRGALPAVRLGRMIRFRADDVRVYVDAHVVGSVR